jgi:hypothetical protein
MWNSNTFHLYKHDFHRLPQTTLPLTHRYIPQTLRNKFHCYTVHFNSLNIMSQ